MATEIYLGYPPDNIVGWIRNHSQQPVAPSPYFTYDENRVITGLHQGEPNIWKEGTYIDPDDGEEKPYSGWTYGGGSNMVENYATAIGDNAFNNDNYDSGIPPSKGITGNITFQNVTRIGDDAFYACSGLKSVTIPGSVTSIGEYAFYNCRDLTNMTIGSGIQGIGYGAFDTWGNPITLTIGKTVAEVQTMGTIDYDYSTNVPYSEWYLPSGSTIVCTDDTITV